jgi:hypothetical protein
VCVCIIEQGGANASPCFFDRYIKAMATVRHLGLFSKIFERCPAYNLSESALQSGLYPEIWMPPDFALAMYWRVKKWRFNYSIQWGEVNAADAAFNWSVSREFTVGQENILAQTQDIIFGDPNIAGPIYNTIDIVSPELDASVDELKLICGVDPAEYETVEFPDFGDPIIVNNVSYNHFSCAARVESIKASSGTFSPNSGTNAEARIYWPWLNSPPAYIRTNDDGRIEILPTIQFEATTFRWTRIRAFNWTVPSSGTVALGSYGTFSYNLLGESFSAPIYAYNSRSHVEGFSNTLSVNASLEAIEYWPYDPNDGLGPIYDSTTGEQLRPFPN